MARASGRSPRLIADPRQPRSSAADRPLTDVAVGILIREDAHFLLTSRPPGKVYAGFWEFPGGKVEALESVTDALHRELQEELGLDISQAKLWRTSEVDYPHALVRLHFCKVFKWSGALRMREGQQFSWETWPVGVSPILPGTVPVLEWLQSEADLGR